MPAVQSQRDLVVWQKAMELSEAVYRLTTSFPATERYRLVDQLSRAVVSVPGNIAEGFARSTPRDYGHFLSIAQGSLNETETYLLLAVRLGYATEGGLAPALSLLTEVGKMLTVLRRRLRTPRP